MKTIIIKTQAEMDALPDSFTEYTVIEIRSEPEITIQVSKARGSSRVEARGSSRVVARESSSVVAWESSRVVARESSSVEAWGSSSVEAWGSSSVEAWGSSSVEAWESSRVVAFDFSMIAVLSAFVIIKHLADYSVASCRGFKAIPEKKDKTARVIKTPEYMNTSFETWLERGYVVADGINKKLISKKKLKNIEIYTVEDFLTKKESFVVRKGEQFSHGETVDKAIESLRYKLSDRDTSRFKRWKKTTEVTAEDAIQSYRAITGACEYGVRQFCESIKVPKKLKVSKVIELTKGNFGHEAYAGFFK